MNDVCKTTIAEKLRAAIDSKGLKQQEVVDLLGLKSKYYPSMILSMKPEQWKKVSREAWERVRNWSNSGETINAYSVKHNLQVSSIAIDVKESKPEPKANDIKVLKNHNPERKLVSVDVPNQKTSIVVDIIIRINGKEISI